MLTSMTVRFQFEFPRVRAVLMYMASQDVPELTKYKICKLVFLADKFHLVKYGRIITGDKYCALPNGPVPSRTLNLLNAVIDGDLQNEEAKSLSDSLELDRRFENPRFKAASFDASELSQSDVMALDKIIAEYGHMGFGELKAITHSVFAYESAWGNRPEGASAADMDFAAFFEQDSDAVVGAREAMLEDDSLRKIFPGIR
jgi:uncharacterized phage-associated protein